MANMKPEVGMGVTYGVGSDRYVGTILHVSPDGKMFWFSDDICTNKAVWPEQDWVCSSNPIGGQVIVSKVTRGKKKGTWTIGGKADGTRVSIGVRNKYCDPHF